jgi:PAS domain S-box-containing protein
VAPDGSIAMANERAVQMFGYPARELVGQSVESLVPEVGLGTTVSVLLPATDERAGWRIRLGRSISC